MRDWRGPLNNNVVVEEWKVRWGVVKVRNICAVGRRAIEHSANARVVIVVGGVILIFEPFDVRLKHVVRTTHVRSSLVQK